MGVVPQSQTGRRQSRASAELNRIRLEQEQERKQHKLDMRAEGRRRDQVEACYRQHTPPQIRFAEGMRKCPS